MTNIPTVEELKERLITGFESEYRISINRDEKNLLVVTAIVFAGALWLYYLAIGYLQKNIWYDTADPVAKGGTLERFGKTILRRYPYGATQGKYSASISGTAGTVIAVTQTWKSDDGAKNAGKLYQIFEGPYTLTGSGDVINILALEGGKDSALNVGDTLTATSPIDGAAQTLTITAEVTAPVDKEDIEDYRKKIDEKVGLKPGGWSAIDYRILGLNVTGVKTTYAYADDTEPNRVNVYLRGADDVPAPGPSVSSGVIADYVAAFELVRPVTVWEMNCVSCPIKNVNITVTMGSFSSYTDVEKGLILSALQALVNGMSPFIASCDKVADRNDKLATYKVISAISTAVPGKGFSDVTITVDGSPTTLYELDNGTILYLNNVSYA